MKTLNITILIILIICLACSENDSPLSSEKEYGTDMDYQIYSCVIDSLHNYDSSYQVILCDSTVHWNIESSYDYISEHFPDLSEETLNNYWEINQDPVKLLNIPDLEVQCHLISPENRGEWREIYPDANVLVHLSRIGYNLKKDQALLYMSDYYAPLAGGGYIVFLKKEEDWVINGMVMLWIS